jgi:hypothetical protein
VVVDLDPRAARQRAVRDAELACPHAAPARQPVPVQVVNRRDRRAQLAVRTPAMAASGDERNDHERPDD